MRMWAFTSTSRRAVATASPDTSARTAEAKTLRLAVLMYLVVFTVKLITSLATGVMALFGEALLIVPQWESINDHLGDTGGAATAPAHPVRLVRSTHGSEQS